MGNSLSNNKILILLFLFLSPMISVGTNDSTKLKNTLFLNANYPIPASGITFKTIYTGIFNVNTGYYRNVYKGINVGIGVDYSLFQTDRKILDTKSTMKIMSPSLNLGLQCTVFKKIFVYPMFNGGYSSITFSGEDSNGNTKAKFKEQGVFIQSSLFVGYLLNSKICIGVTSSYRVIFQHFGNNTTLEDKNIRIVDFGVGVKYKL
jgi:hypothetical protein